MPTMADRIAGKLAAQLAQITAQLEELRQAVERQDRRRPSP